MKKTLLISTVSLLALWFAFAGTTIYNPAPTATPASIGALANPATSDLDMDGNKLTNGVAYFTGLASGGSNVVVDIQATNDAGYQDFVFRVGDAGSADAFRVDGDRRTYVANRIEIGAGTYAGNFMYLSGSDCRIYNNAANQDLAVATRDGPLELGYYSGSGSEFTSSIVRVYDSTGLNTTFTNGTISHSNLYVGAAAITSSVPLTVVGNVDATSFSGDGSALTGIGSTTNYFRATSSTNLPLANNTWTKVIWDTEVSDVGGEFASSTLTVAEDGTWVLNAGVGENGGWGASGVFNFKLAIYKNGTNFCQGNMWSGASYDTDDPWVGITVVDKATAGDTYEAYMREVTGFAWTITNDTTKTFFTGVRVQ